MKRVFAIAAVFALLSPTLAGATAISDWLAQRHASQLCPVAKCTQLACGGNHDACNSGADCCLGWYCAKPYNGGAGYCSNR